MKSKKNEHMKKLLVINTKVHSLLNEVDRIYLENNMNNTNEKVIIEPIFISQKLAFIDRYKYLSLKKERDQLIRKHLYIKRLLYIQNRKEVKNNTK